MSFDNNQNYDPQAVPPVDPGYVPQQPVGGPAPAYYNQAPEPPKSNNNTRTIIIVVAVVVGLICCCCLAFGAYIVSTPEFQEGFQEGLEQSQSLLPLIGV